MLATEAITSVPEEQALIEELDEGLRPLYRDDLPYHNYDHAHDEVLPEVLRLDVIQPTTVQKGRLKLIAGALVHDAGSYLPKDPEDKRTAEQRSIDLTRPILNTCGFSRRHINDIDDLVQSTGVGTLCDTKDQVKMRRSDLANVGGKRMLFLAATANIYCEQEILAKEYDRPAPQWTTYISKQAVILKDLLAQDLSLGDERIALGVGSFNRTAMKNVGVLMTKAAVRDPVRFIGKYGRFLRPLVSEKVIQSISRADS